MPIGPAPITAIEPGGSRGGQIGPSERILIARINFAGITRPRNLTLLDCLRRGQCDRSSLLFCNGKRIQVNGW